MSSSANTTMETSGSDSSSSGVGESSSETGDIATGSSDDGATTSTSTETGDAPIEFPTCDGFLGVGPCESGWLEDECNPYTQDCGEGSKCGFNQADFATDTFLLHAICLPQVGNKAIGEACSYEGGFYVGADDCGPDSWCNNVNHDTMIGECVEQCVCGEMCQTPGTSCQGSGYAPYCGYNCNPLLGDAACPDDWACWPEIGSVTANSAGVFTCKPRYYALPSAPEPACPVGWLVLDGFPCEQLCDPADPVCGEGLECQPLESAGLTCPAVLGACRAP